MVHAWCLRRRKIAGTPEIIGVQYRGALPLPPLVNRGLRVCSPGRGPAGMSLAVGPAKRSISEDRPNDRVHRR